MNLKTYKNLRDGLFRNARFPNQRMAHYSSFAIWNPNDTTDLLPIRDLPETENEKGELKSPVVIIGLNGTGSSGNAGVWRNFHSKGSRADTRLNKFFNASRFRGAYMTDILKTRSEKELDVKKIPRTELDLNFALLKEELNILEWNNSPRRLMIALGNKAYELIKSLYDVKWIWHPSSSKTNFDIEGDIRRIDVSVSRQALFA